MVDNRTGSSQVGCLRVHPAVALAAAAGGELLELGKALLSRDTGLCPLSLLCLRLLYQVLLGLVARLRHTHCLFL